jgi:predicted nucleotidyltransferase
MKKMNIAELLKERRDEILRIAAKYGAQNVRLFGSVARSEALQDSDVDFLVDLEPGRSLFDLGGLLMDLQDLLACKVDIVTEKGLRSRICDRVLKEAKPL